MVESQQRRANVTVATVQTASAPTPSPAPSPSPSPSPSPVLPSFTSQIQSKFSPLFSSVRNQRREIDEGVTQAARKWNESIAQPTNEAAIHAASDWRRYRAEYPGQIVAGCTIGAALLSIPFGRFVAVRNGAIMGVLSALAVNPAATIGGMALARERAAAASGTQRPTTVVVAHTEKQSGSSGH